jgi:predicted nuclease of predicted toxin-antitoxin system
VKLLLDENLSSRLIESLADLYPKSAHVHACKLGSSEDNAIWEYAKAHGFAIVSKDSDFAERSVLYGSPPKIVWIRAGNCSTSAIEELLRSAQAAIRSFIEDDKETCLILRRGERKSTE